ncbi:5-oxoprolinase subunit PxpB [Brevibacillus fulvus]|uniref:Inhibitor of KinA n=1 Tax=Brevibacillus fulvus TaxID=1125967 RepID=A0A938Y0G4_9BACL|nr:5-oxoprolinase subunit PxpB [Brevibacillus fulvus]MBM7588865.1 inhibitor of KinA [Brevibacillus fulvus]
MENYDFFPLGDSGVMVKLGQAIDRLTHEKVRTLADYLEESPFYGMVEYVPAFTTVTVYYDPVLLSDPASPQSPYERVCALLQKILAQVTERPSADSRIVEIPVCYGGELGPDLEAVADYHQLSVEEVIRLHTAPDYLVHMIGFAPGFPYLGGLDERIATPRRGTPRLRIEAGSVGIGGSQTGVYPIESPGGWQLIGKTPLRLFRPEHEPPTLLQAGDTVRFRAITREEFDRWQEVAR